MDEYKKLISAGVYCKSCGCFTNLEPGYPIQCENCKKGDDLHDASSD